MLISINLLACLRMETGGLREDMVEAARKFMTTPKVLDFYYFKSGNEIMVALTVLYEPKCIESTQPRTDLF